MIENSILIASPVNKNVNILKEFLNSLTHIKKEETTAVSYCFVDDNEDMESSILLNDFVSANVHAELLSIPNLLQNLDWDKDDHSWSLRKIDKIAFIKNEMIKYFLAGNYTHLFFIDADLVLSAPTLLALLESDKDIVSNIFWTQWNDNLPPMPQVWLKDFYTLYDAHMLIPKTDDEILMETMQFLSMLRHPGVYRVGGLGACTLLRRKVLEAGVNFTSIYNLSFWGEDRSFCIRAAALGFELFVNTRYPAFHIFRIQELSHLQKWQKEQLKLREGCAELVTK